MNFTGILFIVYVKFFDRNYNLIFDYKLHQEFEALVQQRYDTDLVLLKENCTLINEDGESSLIGFYMSPCDISKIYFVEDMIYNILNKFCKEQEPHHKRGITYVSLILDDYHFLNQRFVSYILFHRYGFSDFRDIPLTKCKNGDYKFKGITQTLLVRRMVEVAQDYPELEGLKSKTRLIFIKFMQTFGLEFIKNSGNIKK